VPGKKRAICSARTPVTRQHWQYERRCER
jgi:hypothetical protein